MFPSTLGRAAQRAAAAPRLPQLALRRLCAERTQRGPLRASMTTQAGSSRKTALLDQAQRYLDVWYSAPSMQGNEEADFTHGQVAEQMKHLLSPDVVHRADGVVHTHDVKGVDGILQELRASHERWQILNYQPQLFAVNEELANVFVALQYKRLDISPASSGVPVTPDARTSAGVMLKKLHFDDENKIDNILVVRQLTAVEQQQKLDNPEACTPADLSHVAQLFHSKENLSQEEKEKMATAVQKFVGAWDSTASMQQLSDVLAEEVKSLDGYGLHKSGKDFTSKKQAEGVVSEVHDKYENKNELLGWAVADNVRIGFEHWQAKDRQNGDAGNGKVFMEGLDLLVFDESCKIKEVVQFTMHPNSQVKA